MATSTDPRRIGRASDMVAGPDPRQNAAQILAWAICWPWNLLWTVCVFNPVRYILEFVIKEFGTALQEISTGRFRDIENELLDREASASTVGNAGNPPVTPRPTQPALVIGDPRTDWAEPVRYAAAPASSTPPLPPETAANVSHTAVQQPATGTQTPGETKSRGMEGWSWIPPTAQRTQAGARQPHSYSRRMPAEAPTVQSAAGPHRGGNAAQNNAAAVPADADPWNVGTGTRPGSSSPPLN